MSRIETDAEKVLELLRLQPNGRLETATIRQELELTPTQASRAIGHLAQAGDVRRFVEHKPGQRGGLRVTQAVKAFCEGCNGFCTLDLPNGGTTPCKTCGATGLVATTL